MMNKVIVSTLGLISWGAIYANAEKRPNVIFIFADDMTYDCMGSLTKDKLYTPNLDYLRENGMYFNVSSI